MKYITFDLAKIYHFFEKLGDFSYWYISLYRHVRKLKVAQNSIRTTTLPIPSQTKPKQRSKPHFFTLQFHQKWNNFFFLLRRISGFINIFYMAQEQKKSIDRTFAQFMQPDLGFRTGVRSTPSPVNFYGAYGPSNKYGHVFFRPCIH